MISTVEEVMNPYFLTYQFKYNKEVQWQIKRVSPGVVMPGINVSKLRKIKIRLPNISLQNQFEVFYHKLQGKYQKIEVSKNEISNLFNALLQRAFNGQLNFNVDKLLLK